jgi:hypothetical protein
MLRRFTPGWLSRAAAAGGVCAVSAVALAAAATPALAVKAAPARAAAAAPAGSWSGPLGPVPRAFTDAAPALAPVSVPGAGTRGLLVAWRGRASGRVFYEDRTSLAAGRWSRRQAVPLARTSRAPSVASYTRPGGRRAEVVVWKGRGGRRIRYSEGHARRNGTVAWSLPRSLPRSARDTTSSAPAIFFPGDSHVAVVAWQGPLHHVRYAIGTPRRRVRGFRWSASHRIPGIALTGTGPAIAEVQSGTATGTLYVFWKGWRTHRIGYSATPDPLSAAHGLTWTAPVALPGALAGTAPAVSALGAGGSSPLLVAYRAPHSLRVRFQVQAASGWSLPGRVPGARTAVAPALLHGILATTSPRLSRNIFLRIFG